MRRLLRSLPDGHQDGYEERDKSNLSCHACLLCGKCIKKCPENGALHITVFGRTIYRSSHRKFFGIPERKDAKRP